MTTDADLVAKADLHAAIASLERRLIGYQVATVLIVLGAIRYRGCQRHGTAVPDEEAPTSRRTIHACGQVVLRGLTCLRSIAGG